MSRRVWVIGWLGLLLVGLLSTPSMAVLKVIVDAGLPFFCDAQNTPTNTGANVCVRIELHPFSQDARSVTETGIRTNINGKAWCDFIEAKVIQRVLAEYAVPVVDTEIIIRGCTPTPAP
jgi:hypothetical protein